MIADLINQGGGNSAEDKVKQCILAGVRAMRMMAVAQATMVEARKKMIEAERELAAAMKQMEAISK